MKKITIASCVYAALSSTVFAAPAFETKSHPNLFVDMDIASQLETKAKVDNAYQQIFFGKNGVR
ncbi:hypothetical protein [Agaribacterium haliotis]|uniref:hypothetical protein n=1 Tax=Agaribacterium haliotis TaxID=2013869 RepID=UPI00117775B5|nr:hypothetical protein [Agaribacterium haliotis]